MARSKKAPRKVQISAAIDADALERIDGIVPKLLDADIRAQIGETGTHSATRSRALRLVIDEGLVAVERRLAGVPVLR
ncbi:MAG: hypothetical protein HY791_39600 [Deltaproteobacteria bacterium]|nr:hypothetical protein [Deltaproteobacteria bacterium]